MKSKPAFITLVAFGALLASAVGCSHGDEGTPRIAGQYALAESLTSPDWCGLGNPIAVPVTISQSGDQGVLTTGVVPGPNVCPAVSEGTVYGNGVFPASGETVTADYWYAGCDLIQTDHWRLIVQSNGAVSGTWSVSFRDDPLYCSGFAFPCTNRYDVDGGECVGCATCAARAAGSPQRPGTPWTPK